MVKTAPQQNLISAESPKKLFKTKQNKAQDKKQKQKGDFSKLLADFETKLLSKKNKSGNKTSLKELLAQIRFFLKNKGNLKQTQESPEIKELFNELLKFLARGKISKDSDLDIDQLIDFLKKESETLESEETPFLETLISLKKILENKSPNDKALAKTENFPKNQELDSIQAKIEVVDLRRKSPKTGNQLKIKTKGLNPTQKEQDDSPAVQEIKNNLPQKEKQNFQILVKETLHLNHKAESFQGFGKQEGFTPKNAQLLDSLKERFQSELVKHTKFILKEGNQGEIRLILKPESLGRVTMRVNLNQNHIEGRIFVENNSVKEVMNASLGNLADSLKGEGYESVALEVSVGQQYENQDRSFKEAEGLSMIDQKSAQEEFDKNQIVYEENMGGVALVNVVV